MCNDIKKFCMKKIYRKIVIVIKEKNRFKKYFKIA